MSTSTARPAHEFRPDIEGLRGIAVLLVVLYHAGLVGVPGGFIGVDVFFVISGFLITGLILRERERSGRISFRAFYARRVRRLLPAGMVALAATLVGASVALAPLDRPQALLDGAAAALSVGNIRFALSAGDYFASVAVPSPFLHFWSLSVEEQFYLAWPALLFLVARGRRPGMAAACALAFVAVLSMAVNVVLAESAVNWAFYSLPSRAWQLALGGLLAVGGNCVARVPRPGLVMAGWLGLVALIAAALTFGGTLAYPGVPALVPTLATVALVACGTTRLGPGVLLQVGALRFLGRISYSLYLWHWPVLILPAAALASEPPITARVGLVLLAIIVASLSWRFIEEPFRTGFPTLARRPGRTILAGVLAVVLVVTGAGGLAIGSSGTGLAGLGILPVDGAVHIEETDTGIAIGTDPRGQNPDTAIVSDADGAEEVVGGDDVPVIVVDRGSSEEPTVSPSAPPSPGGSANPAPATVPRPTAKPKPVSWRLPSDVRPELASVRGDEERLRADGCLAFEGTTVPPDCVYGDPAGTSAIALVGDSHAAQWFPAINRIAIQRHWRLLTFVKVSCPFVDMPIINLALKREYRECAAYRAAVILRLRDEQPRLTIVSGSRFAIHPVRSQDADVGAQAAALARMLDRIQGRVAVIVDTPEPGRDVPSCLSRHADDIRPCAIARATALSGDLGVIERQATRTTGDALIDLTRCVCRSWPCQVVANGIIKFRDTRHLTATFSRSLAGSLDLALDVVLGAAPRPTPSPSVAPTPSGSSSAAVATPTPVPAQTSDRLPVPARS